MTGDYPKIISSPGTIVVLEKPQRNYAAMVMFGPLMLIDEHFLFSSFFEDLLVVFFMSIIFYAISFQVSTNMLAFCLEFL